MYTKKVKNSMPLIDESMVNNLSITQLQCIFIIYSDIIYLFYFDCKNLSQCPFSKLNSDYKISDCQQQNVKIVTIFIADQ